ncbi:MAG TPA: PLP-dependent aminotransferase family protein [Candidatus Binatia bacterium]|jgi:DNA-binding transcriptional MocR family regulator
MTVSAGIFSGGLEFTLMGKRETHDADFLYNQVATHIRGLIDRGTLHPGERLPSIRKLSEQMDVSISTVLQAYITLEAGHFIEARPQSGFYVKTIRQPPPEPKPSNPPPVATRVTVSELVAQVFLSSHDPKIIQLGLSTPSAEYLPVNRLTTLLARAARNNSTRAVNYDFPPGYALLRHEIAKRSLELGCKLSPEEIVTTNGTMEALNLCLRAVAKPGDIIAIESPTFYGTLQAIESLGMKAVEVPTDPRDGIILEALSSSLKRYPVKACLLVLNFNNPLGSCVPDSNKKELVKLLARREIPLIEDDIYGDLSFRPTRPKTAKAYDSEGLVLLCSSFSKTLAPGFRVGWTAPGRFKAQVERLKFMTSMACTTAPQIAVAEFLRSGGYDRHLRAIRRNLAAQVQRMTDAIARYFPPGTKVTRPQGGLALWVELPKSIDSLDLHRKALKERVSIAPGPIFSAKQKYKNFIRISCGEPWTDRIERAMETLGNLARKK